MEGVFMFFIVSMFIAVPLSFFSGLFLFLMRKKNNFRFERSLWVWLVASALAFLSPMLGIFATVFADQKLGIEGTYFFFMAAPFFLVPAFLIFIHFYFKNR